MDWARILAYVTGTVEQELLARNEYLAAENRTMKAQLRGRLKVSDAERGALGEIGHRLGRKALADVDALAAPDRPAPAHSAPTARSVGPSHIFRHQRSPSIAQSAWF
jgi:hypothetical protein